MAGIINSRKGEGQVNKKEEKAKKQLVDYYC
jgi:hypothetical protein